MTFSLSTLLDYRSRSNPDLVLYYEPLGEREQVMYRRQFPMYGDPMKFLTRILVQQGVFVENTKKDVTSNLQEGSTLQDIPAEFLVEGGAAILGWKRKEEETREDFSARIEQELRQAYDAEKGGGVV